MYSEYHDFALGNSDFPISVSTAGMSRSILKSMEQLRPGAAEFSSRLRGTFSHHRSQIAQESRQLELLEMVGEEKLRRHRHVKADRGIYAQLNGG